MSIYKGPHKIKDIYKDDLHIHVNQKLSEFTNDLGFISGETFDELNGKVNEIDGKVNEIDGKVNDLDGKVNETQEKVNETQEKVNEIDGKVNELQLFKFPNVTIFGTPTIQAGQISGFSETNYVQFPFLVDFRNQAFEINMCFTTGPQVYNQENIFDSIDGLAFAVRYNRAVIAMSSDGQTWNMGEHVGGWEFYPNSTYYVKFSWNRLIYKLEISTDNESWYTDIQVTDTRSLYAKQIIIGKGTATGHVFSGSINLNNCSLLIMGQHVWDGMDDAGLSTRLAIDLSNIDQAGVDVINQMIDNKLGPVNDILESI